MSQRTISRLFFLSVFFFGLLPAVGWADQPECLGTWVAAGQRTVTPAEVTGTPQEHLILRAHHPESTSQGSSEANNGYLISGDRIDLVTTCAGYAYIRFHGPRRVSTGWVEESRIKVTGPSHSTLPSDAPMLCAAAEATLNDDKPLASPRTTDLSDDVLSRVHLDTGWNASPPQAAHIVVDGKPLVAVVVDSGGTSHDTSVYVFSNDLRTLLSPSDRNDRDVENTGEDAWAFGVEEDVVIVHDQPMVRSWAAGDSSSTFYLSRIDRDGDIVPTCEGRRATLKHRVLAWHANDRVCRAILAGKAAGVPMHPPAAGESLIKTVVPDEYEAQPANSHQQDSLPTLLYRNNAMASEVAYTLEKTGLVDLDNSGKLRHVGLVSFDDGDSTAGDGSYHEAEIFPVYLSERRATDLSSAANQKLADALPDGMEDGAFVTLRGVTYLELSPDGQGPSSEVWKIDASGAHRYCGFKLTQTVVRPISP